MRYFWVLILSSMVLLPAYAQEKDRTIASFGVGVGYPAKIGLNGDLRKIPPPDNWTMGFQIGGSLGYVLDANDRLIASVSVDYTYYYLPKEGITGFQDSSAKFLTVFSDLKMYFRSKHGKLAPYIKGGTGFFRASLGAITEYPVQGAEIIVRDGSVTQNRIGFGIGTGIDLSLMDRVGIFAETQYQVGLTKNKTSQHLPFKIGIFYR